LKTIDKIKAAREALKVSCFKYKDIEVIYNEDDSFSLSYSPSPLGVIRVESESMIAIADWVLCLFIDDGE